MSRARDIADFGSVSARLDTVGGSEGALSNRNILMNGAQVISQRGTSALTSSASSDTFITDRFRISNYSDATFTGQQVADAPTGFEYSTKVTTTGTDTSLAAGQYQRFITAIEGYNMNHLMYGSSSAKTCTLTFHVKSSLTGQFYVFGFNSAANRSIVVGYTIDAANTWEKKTLTIAGDTSGTWLTTNGAGMYFGWSLGSGTNFHTTTTDAFQAGFYMAKSDQVNVAGTSSATWQITGVQLEVGDTATDFEHRTFANELRRCQRYFERRGTDTSGWEFIADAGQLTSATNYQIAVRFNEQMRAAPTLSRTGNLSDVYLVRASNIFAVSSVTLADNTNGRTVLLTGTVANTSGSAGEQTRMQTLTAGTNFFFDAEL